MMYYYKRKSSPLKWLILIFIFMAMGAVVYWFYINYFSKSDLNNSGIEENVNKIITAPKIISGEIAIAQGEVQINIGDKGYEKAIIKAVLHQGDKIKTGADSLAVINLDDGSKIRLAANSEVIFSNLEEKNVEINQLKGRSYNNIAVGSAYRIKALKTQIEAGASKFELITNDQLQSLAVLVFENNIKLNINNDNSEAILFSRLDANEKALIDLKATKKDQLKIENFQANLLAKDEWYKWNFELDKGSAENLPEQEPNFEEITDSLQIKAEQKDAGVNLTWSVYSKEDFQSYKIMRSTQNSEPKYPEDSVIKSSDNKDLSGLLDEKIEPGNKYYYRICVLKNNDKVACGNVANIETAQKDSTPPSKPNLSASATVSGINLSWTANNEDDFKEYRMLKSISNPEPSYPSVGYLAIRKKGSESYLDKEVNITSVGNVYYRVCSLDMDGNYSCSNVITVENGQVK